MTNARSFAESESLSVNWTNYLTARVRIVFTATTTRQVAIQNQHRGC